MKRILILPSLLAVCLCGCTQRHTVIYANDLSAEMLADTLETHLSAEFRAAQADYLSDYVDLPQAGYQLSVRVAAAGDRIDEYGILHSDIGTEMPEQLLRTYLTESYAQNQDFYDSYIPFETPKLRDAEVRCFGNYVVYAILDPQERNTFFTTIKSLLTAQPDPTVHASRTIPAATVIRHASPAPAA